jgi:hypothetical protein
MLGDYRLKGMHQLFRSILDVDPRDRLKDWAAIRGDLLHTMRQFDEDGPVMADQVDPIEDALLAASLIGNSDHEIERRLARERTQKRRERINAIEQILAQELHRTAGADLNRIQEASHHAVSTSVTTGGYPLATMLNLYDFGLTHDPAIEHFNASESSQAVINCSWTMPEDPYVHAHQFMLAIYVVAQGESFRLLRVPVFNGLLGLSIREPEPGALRLSPSLPLGLTSGESEARTFAEETAQVGRRLAARCLTLVSQGIDPAERASWE